MSVLVRVRSFSTHDFPGQEVCNVARKNCGSILLMVCGILLCGTSARAGEATLHPSLQRATAFAAGRVSSSSLQVAPTRLLNRPIAQAPSSEFNLIYHVAGIGYPSFAGGSPPNSTLAVGPTEVVQAAQGVYSDFNKSTGAIIPLNGQNFTFGNTVWRLLLPGSLCGNSNDDNGELIVKFDRDAQRWILLQNQYDPPYAVCLAVSQTATFADNLWYAYQFPTVQGKIADYTKLGVWSTGGQSDGYYQAWNAFSNGFVGAVICGYDRAKLLAGDRSAEQICFQLTQNDAYLLPADRDSPVRPPATEDEFFIGSVGEVDNSHLSVYSMHINNWSTGDATITGLNNSQLIAVAPYNETCGLIPQINGGTIQALCDRLLYRFAYWDDQPSPTVTAAPPIPPPLQHWLVNHSVATSGGQVGVRWYEFIAAHRSVPVNSLSVFQQDTYTGSPSDLSYRWMASIARDNVQDILLGYSVSSSSTDPSIAVSGRKYSDALSTLSGEQYSVMGPAPGDPHWGQYTTMEIDPSDNCTFFYTNEYYQLFSNDWSTDISSWKFPNCH